MYVSYEDYPFAFPTRFTVNSCIIVCYCYLVMPVLLRKYMFVFVIIFLMSFIYLVHLNCYRILE